MKETTSPIFVTIEIERALSTRKANRDEILRRAWDACCDGLWLESIGAEELSWPEIEERAVREVLEIY